MLTPQLKHFGAGLAPLQYGEADLAVSLLWYLSHVEGAEEVSAAKLAKLMHDLALRGQVNITRLAAYLRKHQDVVAGKKVNSFKIRLSELEKLTKKHEPLLERPTPKIDPHVVPKDEFAGTTRKYLLAMVDQVNGGYQFGLYDACAVLARRLMETLLIEAFENKSHGAKIKNAKGDYLGLGDIILQAKSGQHFQLQRGSAEAMEKIKALGDTAAHSRMYITKQSDIDHVRFEYRKLISELVHLAGIG